MRRTILLVATMILSLLVASGVALATAIGSAQAANKAVGPGESIQKAINAADPGDTIVVRGVHREDVVIRKDGIKLRGDDAVIEPPAKADSPCSKTFGPEAICVLGDVNLETFEVKKRVKDVSVSGFTIRGFKEGGRGGEPVFSIDLTGTRDATVEDNRTVGNVAGGIVVSGGIDVTVADNDVIGNPKSDAAGILVADGSLNTKVVKNVVKNYPEGENAIDVIFESTNTTIAGNDLIGNGLGVLVNETTGTKMVSNDITHSTSVGTVILDSTGTKMVSNDIRRYGDTGISIFGPKPANVKVVGNNISGGPAGIYVADTKGGSFAGNTIHDNCAGMFFEANGSKEPVSGFEVKANTVENNTRSCRGGGFDRGHPNVSGIGIGLFGTTDMEVTANHLSGNVPSGPTAFSGGVVVSTDPFFGGSAKLRNNSVIGNHFGRNKPDIFWDKSGSGNRFVGNLCNTSVPSSLCN
jgi:parallel beta-helix repeat protein